MGSPQHFTTCIFSWLFFPYIRNKTSGLNNTSRDSSLLSSRLFRKWKDNPGAQLHQKQNKKTFLLKGSAENVSPEICWGRGRQDTLLLWYKTSKQQQKTECFTLSPALLFSFFIFPFFFFFSPPSFFSPQSCSSSELSALFHSWVLAQLQRTGLSLIMLDTF